MWLPLACLQPLSLLATWRIGPFPDLHVLAGSDPRNLKHVPTRVSERLGLDFVLHTLGEGPTLRCSRARERSHIWAILRNALRLGYMPVLAEFSAMRYLTILRTRDAGSLDGLSQLFEGGPLVVRQGCQVFVVGPGLGLSSSVLLRHFGAIPGILTTYGASCYGESVDTASPMRLEPRPAAPPSFLATRVSSHPFTPSIT